MISVHTTLPREEAEKFAETLVVERLAACVNIQDIESIYRWEGEVVREDEVLLDVKTARPISEVRDRIEELHPYDVPMIIRFEADANDDYLEWVRESTR